MADLLAILSGAQSSLAAQTALTATASHNIANADNPDYARQIASLEAVVPADQVGGAFVGRGAVLAGVTQARDRFLEARIPRALGDGARSAAESDALQSLHALDPDATGGLSGAISAFYAGLRALAQNPGDAGLRAAALGQATAMTQAFRRTAQQVDDARTGLDGQARALADQVGVEAGAVAALNAQIREARAAGGSPNDLLDLRQKHLDQLATLAGATFVETSQGDVDVSLGGTALVAGSHAGALRTQPDPADGGHLRVLVDVPGGAAGVVLGNGALGGSLGGTLGARDGALAMVADRVDQLAHDLAGALDAAHGYDAATGTGQPLFTPHGAVAGSASALSLAISDPSQLAPPADPTAPGDPTTALAMVATESATVAGGAGVQAALSSLVSDFGAAAANAKAFSEQDGAIRDQLLQMRSSYSGVSIDEEMIAMQKAQRGYEAIARVIQTSNEMLQTLLQLVS
jgi:flagellar hook-associated protein 1 FlgK